MPTQKHLQAFVYTPDKYNMVDMFAGRARLTKAFAEHGYSTCTLDFCRDEQDDSCLVGL